MIAATPKGGGGGYPAVLGVLKLNQTRKSRYTCIIVISEPPRNISRMPRYHPRIVAWRSPEDLIEVKAAFFPPFNDPDQRQAALAKVRNFRPNPKEDKPRLANTIYRRSAPGWSEEGCRMRLKQRLY